MWLAVVGGQNAAARITGSAFQLLVGNALGRRGPFERDYSEGVEQFEFRARPIVGQGNSREMSSRITFGRPNQQFSQARLKSRDTAGSSNRYRQRVILRATRNVPSFLVKDSTGYILFLNSPFR